MLLSPSGLEDVTSSNGGFCSVSWALCSVSCHFYGIPYQLVSNLLHFTSSNANAIALFLETHRGVKKVVYPGLQSHPQHEIAARQQKGYGAMITFYCIGGRDQSAVLLKHLRVFSLAESLGAVESLAECPSLMTQ